MDWTVASVFLHTVVEFVDEEQEMLLRPLGVGDVDVAAGIAEEGPGIVEAWHAFATQPAYLAVAIHHPDLRPHGKDARQRPRRTWT